MVQAATVDAEGTPKAQAHTGSLVSVDTGKKMQARGGVSGRAQEVGGYGTRSGSEHTSCTT